MRILVTADPGLPVPPETYGGIERVIELLVNGLARRGHDVTLIAHPDSRVECRLVPYASTRQDAAAVLTNATLVARTVSRVAPDVIQSFGRLASLAFVLTRSLPKVMSYQRHVTARTVTLGRALSRDTLSFTGCSRRLIADVASRGRWRVVYNAVDLRRFSWRPRAEADAPLVFLGRIEWIKGTHIAIDVARQSGRKLVIAGNVPADQTAYFQKWIRPAIDDRQVTYVGPVNDCQKSDLLSASAALLMPVLWDEPFGIVMAEALACGTPVVGLARGSVPEVVQDGRTGFVCADSGTMAAAISRLETVDRTTCRRDAERRFSEQALVSAYEKIYRDELRAGAARAPESAPAAAEDGVRGLER